MLEEYIWKGWHLWDLIPFLKDCGALASESIFRGQSDSSWGLVPSLYRRDLAIFGSLPVAERYLIAEQRMLDAFFDRAAHLLPNFSRHPVLDRVLAQHFGVPTQLLDWTLDPFVSIYFAVQNISHKSDSAIFFCEPRKTIRNTTELKLPFTEAISQIRPPVIDERIKMQKSVFTIQSFGNGSEFESIDARELIRPGSAEFRKGSHPQDEVFRLGKVVIPQEHKSQLHFDLMHIGIDSSLLFPGLQGIGQRISEQAAHTNYGGSAFW